MVKKHIIDKIDLTEVTFDLLKFPWPIESGSVKEISCVHKMEYIPANKRIPFMEEVCRVLASEGTMTVLVCYYNSARAIQDPSAEWPPYCEQSFLYFNKGWREQNQLPPIRCDFDFTYGYSADYETQNRSTEAQAFWVKHYTNAVLDLQLVLTKRDA